MMQKTNMVVTAAYAVGGPTVPAVPVEVCNDCGGLFVAGGSPMYYGMPHAH